MIVIKDKSKDNKIINLCERYPDKFKNKNTYEKSTEQLEQLNIAIAEMTTDLFCLIYKKLDIL